MLHPRQYLPLGRAVALKLIGDNHAWQVLEPFEQLAKELLGGVLRTAIKGGCLR